jgi:hypothetical protein
MAVSDNFSSQWRNPHDILSLLLLIGGDIVQKAMAQMFGFYIQPFKGLPRLYITPVAFSFGWVAYAFMSLASVIGDKQLMPSALDVPSLVINCNTGYARTNRSWLLGRILRDYELKTEARQGPPVARLSNMELLRSAGLENHAPLHVSLRIDIFDLDAARYLERPKIDGVWVLGGFTIAVQLAISIIPWVVYGDWAVFLITASGTLFALSTGSLRQWAFEKWPGRRLNDPRTGTPNGEPAAPPPPTIPTSKDIETGGAHVSSTPTTTSHKCNCKSKPKKKTVCLTQGNGHPYSMVIRGSGMTWDLETLATARSESLPETPWCLGILAVAWICLLVSVSGLAEHTWFLIAVGGLGMVQNIYACSAARTSESMGLALNVFEERPTIVGSSTCEPTFWPKGDETDGGSSGSDKEALLMAEIQDPERVAGVRGAIRELEKTIPRAGFALMPVFFPAMFRVDRERYRDDREARFWQLSQERVQGDKRATESQVKSGQRDSSADGFGDSTAGFLS